MLPSSFADYTKLGLGVLDAYGSYQTGQAMADDMKDMQKAANPFAKYRDRYARQLGGLMDDPSSISDDPEYKFRMEQGMEAMNATAAAKGLRFSGGQLEEAQKFGQGLAKDVRNTRMQELITLSGAGQGFSTPQAYYNRTAQANANQEGLGTLGGVWGYGGYA